MGWSRRHPPMDEDIRCDVVIVGGGITGALVSHALVRAGISCTVIDRRDIGQGSTIASTALLQYEIDTPLQALIATVGKQSAIRAYRLGAEAIHRLDTLCQGVDDCSFVKRPSLLLARTKSDLPALQGELEARKSARLEVRWLASSELKRSYGLLRPRCYSFGSWGRSGSLSADSRTADPKLPNGRTPRFRPHQSPNL